MRLSKRLWGWLGGQPAREVRPAGPTRGQVFHVVILDGTNSTLKPGCETNAGLSYTLLAEGGPRAGLSLYYEAGIQWSDWAKTPDVVAGKGLNKQIRRAYGFLANRYRPGDKIILLGFSRGAYGVRSLAGLIDLVGLVRPEFATSRYIHQAYRHYRGGPKSVAAQDFRRLFCDPEVEIEMVGVWDTVRALGVRLPILWRFSEPRHAFHNHALGDHIRHGYQALALDETRIAFSPVLWDSHEDLPGHVEQVWFRGTHGDVGGQLGGRAWARPLSNISLVWMLHRVERCGVPLPMGWEGRFPQDPMAPSIGPNVGWGKFFFARQRRQVLEDPSESIHASVPRDAVAELAAV